MAVTGFELDGVPVSDIDERDPNISEMVQAEFDREKSQLIALRDSLTEELSGVDGQNIVRDYRVIVDRFYDVASAYIDAGRDTSFPGLKRVIPFEESIRQANQKLDLIIEIGITPNAIAGLYQFIINLDTTYAEGANETMFPGARDMKEVPRAIRALAETYNSFIDNYSVGKKIEFIRK